MDNIDALIAKVISGNATDDEISKLNEWSVRSEEHQKVYQDNLKNWSIAEPWLDPENIRQDKLRILSKVNHRLILHSRKNKKRSIIYLAAAILAFPVAVALSILFFTNAPSGFADQAFCEISAPAGHLSKCKLPDGTEVWINAGSKITFNDGTFNRKTREVQLEGEAYFEVVENTKKPFYVRTGLADIKVTGTAFNVKSFSGSHSFETVLSEGSIELEFSGEYENQQVKLKPGERAVFDANQKKLMVQNVDAMVYSAWRNGQIIFQDATLNDLIKELERIYDVQFKLGNPDLGNYRFRGTFSYDNDLIDALEKFKVTARIDYYIKDKKVWLSKNN